MKVEKQYTLLTYYGLDEDLLVIDDLDMKL